MTKKNNPKKILILNLTRMGDLIQTTPLIAGLLEMKPKPEITLLGNSSFISICDDMPNISKKIPFDVKQFKEKGTGIIDIFRYIDTLVKDLKKEKFDILVNLTHSKLTAAFGRLLEIKEVRGFYSTPDGKRIINNQWLIYFAAFLAFRKYNSINLVDLYQLAGGVTPKKRKLFLRDESKKNDISNFLKNIGVEKSDRVIGMQAGASLSERRWSPEKFAATADIISTRLNAKVLLFGTANEKELGDKIEKVMKQDSINLLGKTSLHELTSLIERCELLITNDTGTMHIAATVGTPSVALFLVHAYAHETGPYSKGNIIIEPKIDCYPCSHNSLCPHYACFNHVTPEDIADASDIAISNKRGEELKIKNGSFNNANILLSDFDEAGFIEFVPLIKRASSESDILALLYRYFFIAGSGVMITDDYWKSRLAKRYLPMSREKAEEFAKKEKEKFSRLAKSAHDGISLITDIEKQFKRGKIEKVQKLSEGLTDIDREIDTLGNSFPELKPLIRLFELGKENLTGDDAEVMLSKTKILYKGIQTGTVAMISLIGGIPKATATKSN